MEKPDFNYIRDFIITGKVSRALDELLGILQSSTTIQSRLRDDVILLRTQLNELDRQESLNLISPDEASRKRTKLQKGILDVINNLENPSQAATILKSDAAPASSGNALKWAIPLGAILLLFFLGFLFRKQLFGPDREQKTPPKEAPATVTPSPSGTETPPAQGGSTVAPFIDLAVTDLRFNPDPPIQQQQTEVTFTISNNGNAAATNFYVYWWAGANFPQAEKNWTLSLGAGEKQKLSYTYRGYKSWYSKLATKVVVDPNNKVSDKDRSNNQLERTIRVSKSTNAGTNAQADLAFVGWSITPSTPVKGKTTRIDFAIENKGSKTATNFNVQWWAGVNYPQPAKTWTGITLAAGQRKNLTYTYSGYPSRYGQLKTKIVLDPEKRVQDADRSNNEWIKTIKVSQ